MNHSAHRDDPVTSSRRAICMVDVCGATTILRTRHTRTSEAVYEGRVHTSRLAKSGIEDGKKNRAVAPSTGNAPIVHRFSTR
jgi:hypothetical protein